MLDPFKLIFLGYTHTKDEKMQAGLMELFDYYESLPCYANLESDYLKLVNREIKGEGGDPSFDGSKSEGCSGNGDDDSSMNESELYNPDDDDSDEPKDKDAFQYSVADSEDNGKAKKVNYHQMDIIHEWLFSEEVPFISHSDYMTKLLGLDYGVSILFTLILSPFKYILHSRVKNKYRTLKGKLVVDLKCSEPKDHRIVYTPERHNPYYLRSRRAMLVILFKPNSSVMFANNQNIVDIFYRCLKEQVWANKKARANMDLVYKIMQYFLLFDHQASIRNIIKYHIPFRLLGEIESQGARFTLGCLLMPGNKIFKIPQKMMQKFYNY